jgi:hypothetical protein
MRVTLIRNPLPGEGVVAIDPPLDPVARPGWRRRLNLYTGRALTDAALTIEQYARGSRLALLGEALEPGVVAGLTPALEPAVGDAAPVLQVAAGLGLTAAGEDVIVPAALRVALSDVPVLGEQGVGELTLGSLPAGSLPDAGVFLLRPFEADDEPPASVDLCGSDPNDEAFVDRQRVDGCRVVFARWPADRIPLPPRGAGWRNRVAAAVFAAEAALGEGEGLPWDADGLPVAVVGFADGTGRPEFLDHHAVARAGGGPRQRALFPGGGRAALWLARLRQFAQELAEADPATPVADVAARFRYLPPAGPLPLDAVDLTARRNNFFPITYEVELRPLPVDELDAALTRSASLAPYDTFAPDQVRVLVPVPLAVYEPDLLVADEVSSQFVDTVDRLTAGRADAQRKRWALRLRVAALSRAITGVPVTFGPDPGQVGDEPFAKVPDNLKPELDGTLAKLNADGTVTLGADGDPVVLVKAVEDLRATLAGGTPLTEAERGELDKRGLEQFIAFLDDKVRRSDDQIDLGFVRAQTDIYRVRQMVLGSTAATRLATSPVLASIAQGDTAVATREQLTAFLAQARAKVAAQPQAAAPQAAAPPAAPPVVPRASLFTPGVASTVLAAPGAVGATVAGAPTVVSTAAISAVGPVIRPGVDVGGFVVTGREPTLGRIVAKATTEVRLPPPVPPVVRVVESTPIIGAVEDFRTVSVAQRLAVPPAQEARQFSLANRHDLISDLSDLPISIDDVPVKGVQTADGKAVTFAALKDPAAKAKLLGEVISGAHDPVPPDADEAGFFGVAVKSIENNVGLLRLIEGKTQGYRVAMDASRRALAEVRARLVDADRDLKAADDGVTDARQDVAAAAALLAEEHRRVDAINARRAAVLREHVRFLAYHRPRAVAALTAVPVRPIDPGVTTAPVPACLSRAVTVPPEIRAMADLLRAAPVWWFPRLADLVDRLDRLDVLHAAVAQARVRAARGDDIPDPAFEPTRRPQTKTGQWIGAAFAAQRQVVAEERAKTALIDTGAFAGLSWQASKTLAATSQVFAVADLMEARFVHPDVARQSARAVEDIARVASCLYEAAGTVLPAVRLAWAERLGPVDVPVNLRDLSALPRWGEVEFLSRREMQAHVDWLFGQIDPRQPRAESLAGDLVRVALMLASHAPVDDLVAADVARETTVTRGGRVDLNVNLDYIRVGMKVLVYDRERVVGVGVVEDLARGQAVARVDELEGNTLRLAAGAKVHLAEPDSPALAAR